MKAVIAVVRPVPEKPARFVVIEPGSTDAEMLARFRVQILGTVREIDFADAPLAQRFQNVGQGRKA